MSSQPPPHVSLIAGVIAGAVEGIVTYPTEFVKTQLQIKASPFTGPIDCFIRTVRVKGIFGLYRGLSPLVIGNASKAGVRFLTFDQSRHFFSNTMQMSSNAALLSAGLAAGCTEAILVVTPSETIKTKLIHDANQANPRFKGMMHGIRTLVAEEGLAGIYRGLGAVVARQGANSAVRMTTYSLIRERLSISYPVDVRGALAGTVTVYTTMPLDVVKTRLQSLGAKGGVLSNLAQVVKTDGVGALWKGATPRLGRLIFSGGIVFTIFESVVSMWASF